MRERSGKGLDPVDIMIVQELARDGRIPVMQLASRTGISQRAVHSRLNRIVNQSIIKVKAIPIWQFTGLAIEASVGFKVKAGHNLHDVARKLADHPNFCYVALSTGPYDIVTWVFFQNREAFSSFLRHDIGNIAGIESTETLIHLETVKNVVAYPISESNPDSYRSIPSREKRQAHHIDKADRIIIDELQKDGRIPIVALAAKLGMSRASAAKRLQRLLSEGIIMVMAITEPGSIGYEVTGRIGISVLPGRVDDVAHQLASIRGVHFVAVTVGRYDILIGVHFHDLASLAQFLREGPGKIPDITRTENMVYLEIIKSPFEFVAGN